MAQSTILRAKNLTGAILTRGTAVYITGFDNKEYVSLVAPASNDDESKMPAVGIVREDIADGDIGVVKISGLIIGFDTSGTAPNDNVYVGQNGEIVFISEPSSIGQNLVTQQLGVVAKVARYPNGLIQLYPLEIKRRISHPDIINVTIDQHHNKLHSDNHEVPGVDTISHSLLTDQDTDTHTQYSLVGGSRAFTGTVGGITPTASTHLTTKEYVDAIAFGDITIDGYVNSAQGADGYIAFFTGPANIAGDNDLFYDRANSRLGLNTSTPTERLDVNGNVNIAGSIINDDLDQAFQIIGQAADGYALATTENQRWVDSSQQRQDLRNASDGYALATTENQRWMDSSQQRQDLRNASDGYQIQLNTHSGIITDLQNASDGYALATTENQRWMDSSQQRQELRNASDGYATLTLSQGADGYIAFFTGVNQIAGDNDLFYDRVNSRLGLNTSAPSERLDVNGNANIVGKLYIADGSNSAPSIAFTDDINTGIYSPSADVIAIATGGGQRITVNSIGSIGIGTGTIPVGGVGHAKLAIDGTDGDYVNGPNLQFTTSDEDNRPLLQIQPYEHDNISINFDVYNENGTLESSYAGSNFQILKNGDKLKLTYDSDIAAGNPVTMNDGLVLDTAGNIGIGVSSPSEKLEIDGNLYVSGDIQNTLLQNTLDGYAGGGGITATEGADGYIAFFTGPDAIAGDNDLFYDRANSRLGLNTSAPTERLQVNGNIQIDKRLSIGKIINSTTSLDTQAQATDTYIQEWRDSSGVKKADISTIGRMHVSIQAGASATAPGYSFVDNTTVGMYMKSNEVAFAKDGANIASIGAFGIFSANNFTLGGIIYQQSGTVSAPGHAFSTDANTGIYRIAADTIGFTAGGVEGMRIAESGSAITIGMNGTLNMSGELIYSSAQALKLGTSVSTSHSLATGDVLVGGKLEVDDTAYFDSDINIDGYIGFSGSSPLYRLDVYDDNASTWAARFFNDGNDANRYGIIIQAGADDQSSGIHYYLHARDGDGGDEGYLRVNAGTFELVQASDRRLKTAIVPTKLDGLGIINALSLKEYKRKKKDSDNIGGDLHPIGFIAQDCETVFPPMTGDSPDGTKCISMSALVPVLTKAIQELSIKLNDALDRIELLENK